MSQTIQELVQQISMPVGRALIKDLASMDAQLATMPATQKPLRKKHGAELVRLALRLAEARRRTPAKFPDADKLLFTPELLEQATAHPVAVERAGWLAHYGKVLDLGCGAGGDLTRLAQAGADVVGVERDPLAVALGMANLRALGFDGHIHQGEFPGLDLPVHDVLFADPARRSGARGPSGSRRLIHTDDLTPHPAHLRPLLDACRAWAVKWGPGLDLSAEAMAAPEALLEGMSVSAWSMDVVSWKGAVREAVFRGGEAREAGPRAVILSGAVATPESWTYMGNPLCLPPVRCAPGDWIHEPDGALLRANLMNAHAHEFELGLLASGIAYLTAETPAVNPGTRSWRRLDTLAWSRRRVGDALTSLGAGRLVVKTRGVRFTPEEIRNGFNLTGDRELVMFLHRGDDGPVAHICLPLGEKEPTQ